MHARCRTGRGSVRRLMALSRRGDSEADRGPDRPAMRSRRPGRPSGANMSREAFASELERARPGRQRWHHQFYVGPVRGPAACAAATRSAPASAAFDSRSIGSADSMCMSPRSCVRIHHVCRRASDVSSDSGSARNWSISPSCAGTRTARPSDHGLGCSSALLAALPISYCALSCLRFVLASSKLRFNCGDSLVHAARGPAPLPVGTEEILKLLQFLVG